jgi:hypothetical protein
MSARRTGFGDIEVSNASTSPVYRTVVTVVFIQGAAWKVGEQARPEDRICISVVPPGRCTVSIRGGFAGMGLHPAVEIGFTDQSGAHWIRRSNGALEEIEQDAIVHYRVNQPVPWVLPDEARRANL